jgi:hypothetical protein
VILDRSVGDTADLWEIQGDLGEIQRPGGGTRKFEDIEGEEIFLRDPLS